MYLVLRALLVALELGEHVCVLAVKLGDLLPVEGEQLLRETSMLVDREMGVRVVRWRAMQEEEGIFFLSLSVCVCARTRARARVCVDASVRCTTRKSVFTCMHARIRACIVCVYSCMCDGVCFAAPGVGDSWWRGEEEKGGYMAGLERLQPIGERRDGLYCGCIHRCPVLLGRTPVRRCGRYVHTHAILVSALSSRLGL